jgi:tRNA dimethylallyltransferase
LLHNKTDVETDRRAIRAIEIEYFYRENPELEPSMPELKSLNIGVKVDRETRRQQDI